MKRRRLYAVSAILVLIALGILVHQFIVYGVLIELEDMLHHEFIAFTLLALALGIIYANYAASKQN